ncbi:MAG TPA: hypothetical protein VHL14_14800 [Steroidobacteraceae bacterium]|nr:hypothetical protein [Steroidobacteraceae bacterium]
MARTIVVAIMALMAFTAEAGPPYVTDDPAPTDHHHWENYHFVNVTHAASSTSGAAGLDLNYGAAEGLQLTLVLPAEFERTSKTRWRSGDVELAAKYRLPSPASDRSPDLAFFPRIFIPTDHAESSHVSVLLPVWIGKEGAFWNWFGGGGYLINPGEGNRNAWLSGLALTRSIGERMHVGLEIYHQTAQTEDSQSFTGVNAGVDYKLSKHWSLLASFGPGIQHARQEGQYNGYLSFKAEY